MPEPVSLAIKPPPDALTTLGGMMNIANIAQAMQQRGIAIKQAQGVLKPTIEKAQAEASTAQTQSQFAQWKLKSDQAAKAYQIAGGLMRDPSIINGDSKGSVAALMGAEDRMRAHGIPEDQIRVQMGPLYTMAAHQPHELLNTLKNIVVGGIQASGQGPAVMPTGPVITSGQTTQQYNVNPLAVTPAGPVPGTAVQQQLPPSTQVVNPATGQPGYLGPQPAAPAIPGARPVSALPPSDVAEIPIRTRERAEVNAAAARVPEQHFNNQQIINLAPVAFTGTGAGTWAKVFGATGVQWNPQEEASANFQRMGHFMALQAQANASAMGAGTDAARAMAEAATNKQGWTKDAIISTAKVNDALASGVAAFNIGMEKAIANANGNVLAKRDFQNQWSQNFDVRAMQLHNALEANDRTEVDRIVKSVGGAGSTGAKALAQKVRALNNLIANGHP